MENQQQTADEQAAKALHHDHHWVDITLLTSDQATRYCMTCDCTFLAGPLTLALTGRLESSPVIKTATPKAPPTH